jgi:hypothetical protein
LPFLPWAAVKLALGLGLSAEPADGLEMLFGPIGDLCGRHGGQNGLEISDQGLRLSRIALRRSITDWA